MPNVSQGLESAQEGVAPMHFPDLGFVRSVLEFVLAHWDNPVFVFFIVVFMGFLLSRRYRRPRGGEGMRPALPEEFELSFRWSRRGGRERR